VRHLAAAFDQANLIAQAPNVQRRQKTKPNRKTAVEVILSATKDLIHKSVGEILSTVRLCLLFPSRFTSPSRLP
jgi:hypothetical protein